MAYVDRAVVVAVFSWLVYAWVSLINIIPLIM